MRLNKKLISLLCTIAMMFSMLSGFVVQAEETVGTTLSLVSVDEKQVVVNVGYTGLDSLKQISLNIPVAADLLADNAETGKKDVTVDYTAGFATSCKGQYNANTGCIVLTGANTDGMSDADKKIATVTINFANAIAEDLSLSFSKVVFTDMDSKAYALSPTAQQGQATGTTLTVPAPTPVPTEAPTLEPLPAVNKGVVMTLASDACAANKVVFDVTYTGVGDSLKQISVNIPVAADLIADNAETGKKDVTVDYTAGFATSCKGQYNANTGCIVLTGANTDGMSDADKKIARVTINLASDLAEVLKLELSKCVLTDMDSKAYKLDAEGDLKLDPSAIYVQPSDLVPAATDVPATDVPATDVPATDVPATDVPATDVPATDVPATDVPATDVPATATPIPADPRPTMIPTEAPIETEVPSETEAPIETEVPLPAVNKGVVMTLASDACAANKVVFDVTYTGVGDSLKQISVNIPVAADLIADNAETGKKDVTVDYTAGFATSCKGQYNANTGCIVLTGANTDGMSDADHKIARVTINLATDLTEVLKLELSKCVLTDMDSKAYKLDAAGDLKLDPSAIYVYPSDLVPAPEATATPAPEETPAPTDVPTVASTVALKDMLDADKATGEDVYVTVTTKGVYGTDYVVTDADGNIVSEADFFNTIWGYNEAVSVADAINNYTFVIYTKGLEITAALNANGVKVDEGSNVEEPKPTDKPSDNKKKSISWETGKVSIKKGKTKTVELDLNNIDKDDVKNVTYKVTSGTAIVDVDQKSDYKIEVEGLKAGTAKVKATVTTKDGEEYTDTLTVQVTTTSSNSGSGNGGSGSSNSISSIAGTVNGATGNGNVSNIAVNFTDLADAAWAADAINYLASIGVVNGRTATTFEPNAYVTRAEFTKLVLAAIGMTVPADAYTTSSYTDIAADAWYLGYVEAASMLGIVTGYPEGDFRPDALVSRQEMAAIVYRAVAVRNASLPTVQAATAWADADQIGDWAVESVTALNVAGVINGTSATTFEPTAAATRAQAAQIVYNLYQAIN